jgi:hypothetical protein
VCPIGTRLAQESAKATKEQVERAKAHIVGEPLPPIAKKRGRPKKEKAVGTNVSVEELTVSEPPRSTHVSSLSPEPDSDVALLAEAVEASAKLDLVFKPRGPIILHGCAITKPMIADGTIILPVTVSELLKLVVEEIGGNTLEEFYTADVWKRRDNLLKIGKQIAERIGAAYVLARGQMTQDELALVAAISPYSSMEIGAVA